MNKSLKDKIFELADENEVLKGAVFNLKRIVKEKDENVHEITTELESRKKILRMLNFDTTKLDQILNMGQSMSNQNRLGYTAIADSVATTSKIVFVKATPTITNQLVSSKNVRPPMPEVKVKKFVPICHFCNILGHICPKCFKYKNIFRMNRIETLLQTKNCS